jgi:cell division protein FtsL
MFRYFYWLIIAGFVLSFYVWQQTQSTRLGYSVDKLRKECEKWEQENKDLRFKVNCLLSMERLDKVAKEKQLVTPDEKSTIFLAG